jgi:hypothetical protein
MSLNVALDFELCWTAAIERTWYDDVRWCSNIAVRALLADGMIWDDGQREGEDVRLQATYVDVVAIDRQDELVTAEHAHLAEDRVFLDDRQN